MLLSHMLPAVANLAASAAVLARPSAPAFTIVGTAVPGEYLIDWEEPASWGDLATAGDGLGAPGIIRWHNAVDGWQTLADPSAAGSDTIVIPISLLGSAVVLVQGVSDAGRVGVSSMAAEEAVTADGEVVTVDLVPVTIFIGG
jgi:hypothetical protein